MFVAQLDTSGEEDEAGCVLLAPEVDKTEVVESLPVQRRQVVGPFQAADSL